MEIDVIATTHVGYNADKNDFDMFSGKMAGVCYMPSTFEDLKNEDETKTIKRMNLTKNNGHHSVFDHENITMYINDIPKILAMVINNEHQYATSEKSARYTKMTLSPAEQTIYNKWLEIFKTRISKKYSSDYPQFFTPNRIEKLAQENARYLISIFTPTSMVYTTTYRQLNYLVAFMKNFVNKINKSPFEERLAGEMLKFVECLKGTKYLDEKLCVNDKNRHLSLFGDVDGEEYYGDVYCTNYKASFAELAQAQRHRTLDYKMTLTDGEYFVPPIIADNADLKDIWLGDMKLLADNYPQGLLLNVTEMGTMDNFILKMYERKCTFAQLEINMITIDTAHKYEHALKVKNHPRAEEMKNYLSGSRCTFMGDSKYICTSPCGFPLGINETRDI